MSFFYPRSLALFAGKSFMADIRDKLPDNTPGKFYVDTQCIDCDVCRDTSPANFRRNDENGYSYVHKQPENDEELALCEEAFNACPVEAIGDDGAFKAAGVK
jgi:ferredoxin